MTAGHSSYFPQDRLLYNLLNTLPRTAYFQRCRRFTESELLLNSFQDSQMVVAQLQTAH